MRDSRHALAPSAVLVLLSAAACSTSTPPAPPAQAAPPPSSRDAGADCQRTFASDAELRAAPEGTPTTIEKLFASQPSAGRFTLTAYVQFAQHCGTCPPGASCKPCDEELWLSEAPGAYKHPMSDGVDLRLPVHDASKFELHGRYRITLEICAHRNPTQPLADRELRGYRELRP